MRVVHVVLTKGFAGTERYVCDVANAMAERGHEVTVVGGPAPQMQQELTSAAWVPAAEVRTAVRAIARAGAPDILHSHLTAADVAVLLGDLRHRSVHVATRHIAARRGSRAAGRFAAPFVRRALDAEVAISDFVAAALEQPPTHVVTNGVPRVDVRDVRRKVVLVLQRLEAEKQTATAIRAFLESGVAALGWRLVVAGEGQQRPALQELIDSLGGRDCVELLGFVPDVGSLLAAASVLLAPATAEPLGLSVLEAMSYGLPVVAARGGGHVETLGADYEGLFAAGDVTQAACLLRDLCGDDARRATVGEALQGRQRALFDVEQHLTAIEAVYREALAASTRRGPRR